MNEMICNDLLLEPERYELFSDTLLTAELDRRAFFRIVGGGLIVACVLGEAMAQQPGRGRRGGFGAAGPKELGAWLHVGEDSVVTVYTGKVEIGQNIRTSLTQVVAEELHLPMERIRLVMADTQLVPFDGGTAGSMTTPRMAPQLRRAAAAARELLLDLAAEQGTIKRAELSVKDGKVMSEDGKTSFTFGQLTHGKKLMKVIDDKTPITPAEKWTTAGTSPPKADGRDFVTGKHPYASDMKRPGMVFGKILRPASFKAELVSVQTREAEALPGVTVVHDGPFVGVTAPTEHAATKALAALHAEWKMTPQPSSEELFEYLKKHPSAGRGGFGGRPARDSRGSIADGLRVADRQIKATYTIAYIAHAPMEPRAAVAEWNEGKLTVWTGTQMPFRVRSELASALKMPEESVRVIVPDMGSGYGGKHSGEAAVEAARLAKAAGKPVKLVWTREEEFTWAYFRPAGVIEVSAGASKDGTLTAWECHNYNSGASSLRTPYESANVHTEFHTTEYPLRQGSYRALAATANTFAREMHMDDLAHALHLDPLAFRLKNLKDERLRAVLEAVANRFGWGKGNPAADHGFGIACGTEKGSYVATCAEVVVERGNGRVKVLRVATAFECGAILNPNHLKNQVEGAVMMALGGALFEAIRFANGKILNPRFSDYRVPRFADLPLLETVLLDRKDLPSAGAGETPLIALAPAVGNAIFQASGVRLRSLPMAPKGVRAS
ncbi:MAG TPA: molybdopterin cofactor-binding domain-containing protein [Gemmataceae bacterium]|nr:molybdopterin cofactor-binding domain-containing protein [Gemmataceae bacterium]